MKTMKRIENCCGEARAAGSVYARQLATISSITHQAETTKAGSEDELEKIVHGRVDPTTSLGEQNTPILWRSGLGLGIAHKDRLVVTKVLQHKRGQVSIFSEVQQVLGVQRVDAVLGVVVDHRVGNEQRTMCVGSTIDGV